MKNTLLIIFGALVVLVVFTLGKTVPLFFPSNSSSEMAQDPDELDLTEKYSNEEQNTVYLDVKFGDSRSEYESKMLNTYNDLGGERFRFYPWFTPSDQLYVLEITGFNVSATHFDTDVRNEVAILAKIMAEKYGQAHEVPGFPNFLDLRPGKINWVCSWGIGNKVIKIGVATIEGGSQYHSVMRIIDERTAGKIAQQQLDSKAETIRSDSQKF